MRLITHYGTRLDNLTPLERLTLAIRTTPYSRITRQDKQHLVAMLADEHNRRESVRFSPVNRRQRQQLRK